MLPQDYSLALKAFYLGRRICKSHREEIAISRIETAVDTLGKRNGNADRLRELFYLLLLAEITRGTDRCVSLRGKAARLAEANDFQAFGLYMKIVDATQTRIRTDRLTGQHLSDPDVRNEHGAALSFDWRDPFIHWDSAMASLGLDDRDLSERDMHFLYEVSLDQMLRKHGID